MKYIEIRVRIKEEFQDKDELEGIAEAIKDVMYDSEISPVEDITYEIKEIEIVSSLHSKPLK